MAHGRERRPRPAGQPPSIWPPSIWPPSIWPPGIRPPGIRPPPIAADDGAPTEEPTADRLRRAREQGMVARSAELSAACVLLLGVAAAAAAARPLLSGAVELVRFFLTEAAALDTEAAALDVAQDSTSVAMALRALAALIAPVAAVALLAALGANLLQVGVRFGIRPLMPDLRRVAPRPGRLLRSVFSADTGFGLAMAAARAAMIGGVAFLNIRAEMAALAGMAGAPLAPSLALIAQIAFRIAVQGAAVLLLAGAADLLWRRRRHRRALRMTRREVAEERRRLDGDARTRRGFAERSRRTWGLRRWPT